MARKVSLDVGRRPPHRHAETRGGKTKISKWVKSTTKTQIRKVRYLHQNREEAAKEASGTDRNTHSNNS